NDTVQVVVSGALPNSCYKSGPVTHDVDVERKGISIDVTAYHTEADACLMYYVPFTDVVTVGLLRKGESKVVVNGEESADMPVAQARTDDKDNFTYANIMSLSQEAPRGFVLQGFLPNSCSSIAEIRVLKEDAESGVIAVLPIVGFSEGCEPD